MASKKSFKDEMMQTSSAAASYISILQDEKKENKSKRFNLLIRPSLHVQIEKIAVMKRKSVNDLVNSVLEDYAKENSDLVGKYDATFNEEV